MSDSLFAETAIAHGTMPCRRRGVHHLAAAGLVLWGIVTMIGFAAMLAYANTSGPVAESPTVWPSDTRLQRNVARANLVVLVHPRCPCSRATLTELAEIMRPCRGLVTAHVLFLKPSQFSDEWATTDLWDSAAAMSDVRVMTDEDGLEARRFGATTSGHVALFATDGRRLFQGGITVSRGHQGDNVGRRTVIDLLIGATAPETEQAVFGCPLFSDESVDCAVSR